MGDNPVADRSAQNMLAVRHRVVVDEKIIYEGEDWSEAATTFLRSAQRVDVLCVIHQVDKKHVPFYSDPRTIW